MKKKHPWYKSRGYSHFDLPLSLLRAENLVKSPSKVATHAFYPFLRYTVRTQKIEKIKPTGLVIAKPPKNRPISFACHADSHIYSYYSYLLTELYEKELNKRGIGSSVLAFRQLGKSNIDFANDAFEQIKKLGNCVAFATDIVGFFDNLNHAHLKKSWMNLLGVNRLPDDHFAVFKSLTNFSYVRREDLFPLLQLSNNNPPDSRTRLCSASDFRNLVRKSGLIQVHRIEKGIPQGSPISALLSNIYLLEFDMLMNQEMVERGGVYLRYCDDILCIAPITSSMNLNDFVDSLTIKYGLEINESKTETVTFTKKGVEINSNGLLQYLGFTFDGKKKLIRSAAFAKFSQKMRRGISLAKQTAKKHNKKRGTKELIWKDKIYEKYSHLGNRNFVRYGLRAAEKMNSSEIKRQLKPLWNYLKARIKKADNEL